MRDVLARGDCVPVACASRQGRTVVHPRATIKTLWRRIGCGCHGALAVHGMWQQVSDTVAILNHGLPFDADRFDVVIVESVLAFVTDKPRALAECIRVTRPGGHVGVCGTACSPARSRPER